MEFDRLIWTEIMRLVAAKECDMNAAIMHVAKAGGFVDITVRPSLKAAVAPVGKGDQAPKGAGKGKGDPGKGSKGECPCGIESELNTL